MSPVLQGRDKSEIGGYVIAKDAGTLPNGGGNVLRYPLGCHLGVRFGDKWLVCALGVPLVLHPCKQPIVYQAIAGCPRPVRQTGGGEVLIFYPAPYRPAVAPE